MEHWLWIILAALFFGLIAGDKISPVQDEVSQREGQSVTLTCRYETTDNYPALSWYRHHSDLQAPQFILWKGARSYRGNDHIPDKTKYGSETSQDSTELTIKDLTLADTALYYCALEISYTPWGGFYTFTFGNPISLKVIPKDNAAVAPAMFVLSPLQPEGQENYTQGLEVCLATDFRPQVGTLVLNATKGLNNVMTSKAVLSTTQKTYYYAAFTNQMLHSCELHGTPGYKQIIKPCAVIHPVEPTNAPEHESLMLNQTDSCTESAKLNYFLLVMHAVRVVFTKTLAFNTLLTIRAVLF